ncbi:MAG: sigma 54-interacting transcriptional regulator, partial [Desulfovermiculus sp.]|nr:sigma 54-interacting transcriptional regulator [Desulfovermiculus sp.]
MDPASLPLSNRVTRIILESISDGVFTVDHDWKITTLNRAAEHITGISRDEALGRYCWEVFRSTMCETGCPLQSTFDQGTSTVNVQGEIIDSQGRRIPVSVSAALLQDEKGRIWGGVETFRDLSDVEALRQELHSSSQVGEFVSKSRSMQSIFKILPRVAQSESTVLILGETGTGKELLARTIHDLSPRRDKPFVAVNCAALPESLLESELFGYKAGAFTDAKKDKPGHLALAQQGTLFLDEIAETSQAFQVKLLRVLQEREFTPLGGTKAHKMDTRIITASNRDLSSMVQGGEFRQDLFYRINVVKLALPPLRERKEDIPLLIDTFVQRFNSLYNRHLLGVSQQALQVLMHYDYPGNIRELENIIECAFVLCPAEIIDPEHLPEHVSKSIGEQSSPSQTRSAVQEAETRAILKALEDYGYNRLQAARALGMHKSTLYRKMAKYGLNPPSSQNK